MSTDMKPPLQAYSTPPFPVSAPPPGNAPPPRKSTRWVWIILASLVLLALLSSMLFAFGLGVAVVTVGGPTIASDQYYSAIRNQDYARAYTYLGSSLKAELSQEAFTQGAQQQDAAAGRVIRYAYTNIPIGDPATIHLTVTRANGASYTVKLVMWQEAGSWKVAAFDRI
jgi:hypothetical protein